MPKPLKIAIPIVLVFALAASAFGCRVSVVQYLILYAGASLAAIVYTAETDE